MHWSLDELRDISPDEWDELILWLKDRKDSEEEGINADDIVAAKIAADEAKRNG